MQENYDNTLIKIEHVLQSAYARQKCSKQTKIADFIKI